MKVLNEKQKGLLEFVDKQITAIDKDLNKMRNNIKILI